MSQTLRTLLASSFRIEAVYSASVTDDNRSSTAIQLVPNSGSYRVLLADGSVSDGETDTPFELLGEVSGALGALWQVGMSSNARVTIRYTGTTTTGSITWNGAALIARLLGFPTSSLTVAPNATAVAPEQPFGCVFSFARSNEAQEWQRVASLKAVAELADGTVEVLDDGYEKYTRTFDLKFHPTNMSHTASLSTDLGKNATMVYPPSEYMQQPPVTAVTYVPPFSIMHFLRLAGGKQVGAAFGTFQEIVSGTSTAFDKVYLSDKTLKSNALLQRTMPGWDKFHDVKGVDCWRNGSGFYQFGSNYVNPAVYRYQVSFVTTSVGAYSSLNADTGLHLLRASSGSVQTSDVTVDTSIPYDTARIGQRTATTASRGLVYEIAKTNVVADSRDMGGTGWGAGSSVVTTANYAVGPDGLTKADRANVSAGGLSNYINAGVLNGTYFASCWLRNATGTGVYQLINEVGFPSPLTFATGSTTTAFQRVGVSMSFSTENGYVIPVAGLDNSSNGGYTARAIDNVIDMSQLEQGLYPTEFIETSGSAAARAQELFYHSDASQFYHNGRLKIEMRIIPKGSMQSGNAEYGGDQIYLYWVGSSDENRFYIESDALDAGVVTGNNESYFFATPLTWNRYDVVDFYVDSGDDSNPPKFAWRVNEGAVTQDTPAGAGVGATIDPTGQAIYFLSSHDASAPFSCWLQYINCYTNGNKPDWVS